MMGIAALALASCAQEEVVETSPSNVNQREIGFEMYVGNPTKAVINSAADLTAFNVWGGYDNQLSNVFNNVEITNQSNIWKPTDVANAQYWAAGKEYHFAAYAPAAAVGGVAANDDNQNLNFTDVTINAAAQNDLIYATGTKTTSDPLTTDPGSVALNFDHLLSMIKVTVSSGFNAEHTITVSDLKIAGMYATADFDGATKAWTVDEESVDATGFTGWSSYNTASTAGEGTKASSNEFIVMPQTLPAGVTISFRAVVKDGDNEEVASHDFAGTLSGTWANDSRYNYTVTLGPDDFKDGGDDEQDIFEITFTPVVDSWDNSARGDTGITVE